MFGNWSVIGLPHDAAQLCEYRGQLQRYCLVEGDGKPFPALQLELTQKSLLLFAAKPLRIAIEELREKTAAL